MKTHIAILSSLLCMYGVAAVASECDGADCDIKPAVAEIVHEPETLGIIQTPAVVEQYATPVEYVYADAVPMRSVKLLSVKPVGPDNRKPVWDGTDGKFKPRVYDKTVDWRNGVPIWDDSISSYKEKDFSDWFLEPLPELYASGSTDVELVEMYDANMADAAATRARIDELLTPHKPEINLWTDDVITAPAKVVIPERYAAQDMTETVNAVFGRTDGCPFETDAECDIWRRKPIMRENVSPRSPMIRADNMNAFIAAAQYNLNISANDAAAAPLLARYKMLMNSAHACCTDGMVYSLKNAGASDGLVYKFMADDANFYGFGARCLMMTDTELDTKYPNTATAAVAADVRNGCLCRGRQWFSAMLAPFQTAYATIPEFANAPFNYTYTDGLQRRITVSVNADVQNVLNQLAKCP